MMEMFAEMLCVVMEVWTGVSWDWSYNEPMELQVYRSVR